MNLERHIRRLNRLLLRELGEDPPFQWIHSQDRLLQHEMAVYNGDGSKVLDYYCDCGRNVAIHKPACKSLTEARQRTAMRSKLAAMEDRYIRDSWVMCYAKIIPESAWKAAYDTLQNYPPGGLCWYPLAWNETDQETGFKVDRGIMLQERPPTEDQTNTFIYMYRDSEELTPRELDAEFYANRDRIERKKKAENIYQLSNEMMAGSFIPGSKGEKSYPAAGAR